MTKRERAYIKKQNELIEKVGRLEDREVVKTLEILEGARKNVAAAVASTEWEMCYIPQLKEGVNRAIEQFKQRYMGEQSTALLNHWNAGIDMVDSPLQFVGVKVLAPEISRVALEISQGYSADLISGLSADALKRVNGEITLGIMGAKPVQEVIKAIGRNLDDKSIFKSIAARAEAITRTELGKVNSLAREARIQSVVKEIPPGPPLQKGGEKQVWMKKWISSGKAKPRAHHAGLDGVTIPVDEKFLGYIDYPHAPGLPAEEVVNCG